MLDDDGAEYETKVKVKVTLVIDDFIFSIIFYIAFVIFTLTCH